MVPTWLGTQLRLSAREPTMASPPGLGCSWHATRFQKEVSDCDYFRRWEMEATGTVSPPLYFVVHNSYRLFQILGVEK